MTRDFYYLLMCC